MKRHLGEKGTTKKIIFKHIIILLTCTAYILIINALNIGCPFRWVTGIPCPACGTTRAYVSFFNLDFKGAFLHHPLFWLLPILLFIGIHKDTRMLKFLSTKTKQIILILGAVLFITVYFIRLFNGWII